MNNSLGDCLHPDQPSQHIKLSEVGFIFNYLQEKCLSSRPEEAGLIKRWKRLRIIQQGQHTRHPSATTPRLVASLPAPQARPGLRSCVGQDQAAEQLHGLSGQAGTWRAGLSFTHLACICLPAHQQGNNNREFVAKAAGSARCLSDWALKNLIFSKRGERVSRCNIPSFLWGEGGTGKFRDLMSWKSGAKTSLWIIESYLEQYLHTNSALSRSLFCTFVGHVQCARDKLCQCPVKAAQGRTPRKKDSLPQLQYIIWGCDSLNLWEVLMASYSTKSSL